MAGPAARTAFFLRAAGREPIAAHRLMTLIVVLMVVVSLLWGERVQAGGGLGWDGVTYGRIVRGFDAMVREGALGTYYAQRILPAVIVRTMLLAVSAPLTNENIILAFQLLNGVLIIMCVQVWAMLSRSLDLSVAGRWLGFTALFINYQLSKQSLFYPVLTDVTTLLLSLLLVLFYVRRMPLAMAVVSLAGAFCWPTLAITGAILILLLPREPYAPIAPQRFTAPLLSRRVLMAAAAVLALCVLIQLPALHDACAASGIPARILAVLPLQGSSLDPRSLFPDPCLAAQQAATAGPTLLLTAYAVAVMALPIAAAYVRRPFLRLSMRRVALTGLATAALVLAWAGVHAIGNPRVPNPNSIFVMARLVLFPAAGKIFLPIISNVVFWGPMLLVIMLAWRPLSAEARHLGIGIVAVIGLSLGFGLAGEPRFLTTAWPILVVLGVLVLEHYPQSRTFALGFVALSLVLAQFWLPINAVPWRSGDFENIMTYPKQLYFMHYGLWMGWPAFVGQLLFVLIAGWWLRQRMRLPQRAALPA